MDIPVGFSQVNLRYTGLNTPTGAEVTFGIENVGGDTPAGVAAAVASAYSTANLDSLFSSDSQLSAIRVKNGPNATGPFSEITVGAPGTDGSDPNPPQVALLCKKSTNTGGRRGTGRLYWPNVPANKIGDDGLLDAAYQSAAQTVMNAFITDLGSSDIPMVLLHGESGFGVPHTVIGLTVQARCATQRRRNRR